MIYRIYNGPMPTTAAQAAVATGNTIKTLMQLKASGTAMMKVLGWGISFDGYAAAQPIKCELLQTDVAATVTAYVAADIVKIDAAALAGGDPTTNLIQVGTSASGYTSSNEGSITATRVFDAQYIAPSSQYVMKFDAGREPMVEVSKYVRVRVTAPASVNAYCYIDVEV